MMNRDPKRISPASAAASGRSLQRLQLELALDLGEAGDRPLAEKLAHAAEAAGADLLFVLPAPNGEGMTGVMRLDDDGQDYFLQVGTVEAGFAVADEDEMDTNILGLARASVEVLRRMSADRSIRGQLSAPL